MADTKTKQQNPTQILKQMIDAAKLLHPMNAIQMGVDKTVKKWIEKKSEEALEAGTPPGQVMQQVGLHETDGANVLQKLMSGGNSGTVNNKMQTSAMPPNVAVDDQQTQQDLLKQLIPQASASQASASQASAPTTSAPKDTATVPAEGMGKLQQLLFSAGVGMAAAGGQKEGAVALLKMLNNESSAEKLAAKRLELTEKRYDLEVDMEKRRIEAEKRKGLQETKDTIYNSGAEFTDEDLKDPSIAKIVGPLIKQNRIEPIIDPETGKTFYSIPPRGVLDKVRKEVAAINLKKKELGKELSDYFAVGDSLPTVDGLGRFAQGAELYAGSIFQSDKQGAMAAQLAGLNKRLRVKLVRAAGDVGNLNIVEQDAAEKLLYNFSDSTSLRELKKSFLLDLTKAVDSEDPMKVKVLVNKWMKTSSPTQEQQPSSGFTTEEETRYQELLKRQGK